MGLRICLPVLCSFYAVSSAYLATTISSPDSAYDYVVVGGGTSGLAVANRLSEHPDVTVLVIEYGDLEDGSPGTLVPGLQPPQQYSRSFNSTPQQHLNNRLFQLSVGQVVGGGSAINGMFLNRGSAEDYDAWEELGNPGWGWQGLLPYFKKSENYTAATKHLTQAYPLSSSLDPHGTEGPIGSSYPPYAYEITEHGYRAWESLDVELNPQSNAGRAVGAFYAPFAITHWNMSRSSSSAAYYRDQASKRANLHLLPGHQATKILFDGKRACRVRYMPRDGSIANSSIVNAREEIILAAGAVISPQLLQLSGIGAKDLLQNVSIPIITDLPGVGSNLHDNPPYYTGANYSKWTGPTPEWVFEDSEVHAKWRSDALKEYYENRTGPYTIPYRSTSNVCFLPLHNMTADGRRIIDKARKVNVADTLPPGTDVSVIRGHEAQRDLLLRHYASRNTATEEITFDGSNSIIAILLKQLSRGHIKINSSDPTSPAVIDFGAFSYPTDLDIVVAAIKKVGEFIRSEPMKETGLMESTPGMSTAGTDEDIVQRIRQNVLPSWLHPVGTCSMMPRAMGGVVDSELKVYGTDGLRVVDASIFPISPATHPMSTVYAVAEKAADMIKSTRQKRH